MVISKKNMKLFCQFKKLPYLCTAIRKRGTERGALMTTNWALSSAGSERLPYKQRVGGSTPSAPTLTSLTITSGFFRV